MPRRRPTRPPLKVLDRPIVAEQDAERARRWAREDARTANPLFSYCLFRTDLFPIWMARLLNQAADQDAGDRIPVAVVYDRNRRRSFVLLGLADWTKIVGQEVAP